VKTIEVPIDDKILAQLDELVPIVSDSEAVRELGIVVTRETVARLALVRGLKDANLAPPPPGSSATPSGGPTTTVSAGTEPPKAAVDDDVVAESRSVVDAPRDNAGMIRIPDGWNAWRASERVPEAHGDVHSYYDRQGWRRYWGRVGEETMVFYWSPDPSLQDIAAYDGSDPSGKVVKVQDTPYGPGHLVPHGWGG
jgi:hypothetical protein